jgi:hypothetical protein
MDAETIPTPAAVDRHGIAELSRRAESLAARPSPMPQPLGPGSSSTPSSRPRVPDRPCPECGETMTDGYVYRLGEPSKATEVPVFPHLKTCAALTARLEREDRERNLRVQAQWREQRANLPRVGPDSLHTLAEYRERFGLADGTRAGFLLAERFAEVCRAGEVPPDGFSLEGPAGTGKTTLIEALARELIAAEVAVRWETAPDLYNALLAAMKRDDFEAELRRLQAFSVVILDDLGREKPTPWWVDQCLFPFVNQRYRTGRPLILTTNYTWPELESLYDGARNDREMAHSGRQLVDRLKQRCASVRFGTESHRAPGWSFVKGGVR